MKYMRYQNFIETVKEHMQQELQKTVYVYPVLKNNGAIYDGLVILDPILNISPTIYLNPYFHRYLDGVSLEDIYEDILKTYHENLPQEDFDITLFRDYEKAQKRIVMKLINAEKNKQLLKQVPHILVYDLAIVFLCSVSDFMHEYATILVYNQHLKLWNVTAADLYETALSNSPRVLESRLDNLHDVFAYITDESLPFLEELNISILTNHLKIHGATCILYPNILEEIATLYEDDVIIIPSSIHEVLVFPKENLPNGYTLENLNAMIQDVNETQLTDDEILSDHIYWYHRDTKEITY
ncbi:MAG: hypothetical protein IJ455_01310 [Agathobacter sp.]|nr:hypothetical protein [Agathobacter sp.]